MTYRGPLALLTALALTAAGCGSAAGAPEPAGPVATILAPSAVSGTPDLDAPQVMAEGLDVPWGLGFLPDGDALIGERNSGRILRLTPGAGQPREVFQVPGVTPAGEGGLLGLAVSPDFARDNLVYVYFTAENDNRISRFRLDTGNLEVVFDGITKGTYHNGGRIAFGPDGMLYAGVGDAQNTATSQDPDSVNGKILRLTPDGQPAPGNPTPGSPVFSLGHRNVQGLAWDSAGRMFAAEFGQDELDEVNLIEAGHNYGWPDIEGEGDTHGGRYTNPLVTWKVADASPSGIAINGATAYVAALRGQRLWTLPLNGATVGEPVAHLHERYGRLRTVQIAADGALWATTSNTDGIGNPSDGDDRILRFPAR
ncbi:PQQ-dependent sugar dehydrogenase [Actinoplanes couchii]|uniref:Oxidoreductase n=1 Tax=Actinoplanes couchii TaxID=403638 RepID=A0ABQ3XI07_9ACTN|nr:PQQ-dependent sugar dehydrogenase [Actinoplanes couchii]MDR6317723.1 glucose/arabinose dehydrogenase [Actinoplanes couchii]GID58107.1 oxidoreductase [Actinoplanes couchii]